MFKRRDRKTKEASPGPELAPPGMSPAAREALRSYTPARIGLERRGISLATRPLLDFQLAHARARDAVHGAIDVRMLCDELRRCGLTALALESKAADRSTYLRRPDLGRVLSEESASQLIPGEYDAVFVIADGLSALAVERHALHLLRALLPLLKGWRVAPVCVVEQGRVAVGDAIGEALNARLAVVLIGERPGLSSPDSLGVYLTWEPRRGRKDAERNCISNIREEGLSYAAAASRLYALMQEASRRRLTGVGLKDPTEELAGLL
ncbi:MAG TPA: ethanolamine ammonia-lyase subunit EutC [Acidobacteriaceae bacterium]|nr:ethanolamine ammonia-lyase subunit EutC [Acidobacteriaceae bacterium]